LFAGKSYCHTGIPLAFSGSNFSLQDLCEGLSKDLQRKQKVCVLILFFQQVLKLLLTIRAYKENGGLIM
jgi:hypothetical protein